MFTDMLQAEVWRKKLEAAGYKVVGDAWDRRVRSTARGGDEVDRPSRPSLAPAPSMGR